MAQHPNDSAVLVRSEESHNSRDLGTHLPGRFHSLDPYQTRANDNGTGGNLAHLGPLEGSLSGDRGASVMTVRSTPPNGLALRELGAEVQHFQLSRARGQRPLEMHPEEPMPDFSVPVGKD